MCSHSLDKGFNFWNQAREKKRGKSPTMSNQSQVESTLSSGFGAPAYLFQSREYWRRMNLLVEGMRVVGTIYCLGFLSNVGLPILWIFFKKGFASTSNINFFSLGGADLGVCIFYIVSYYQPPVKFSPPFYQRRGDNSSQFLT